MFLYAEEPVFKCKVALPVELLEIQMSVFSEEAKNIRYCIEFLLFMRPIYHYGFKYMNWVLSMVEWVGNALLGCKVTKKCCVHFCRPFF